MNNPQTPRIILVDRTEVSADRHGAFLKIQDMAGQSYRIAEKRQALWPVFQTARRAEPILTTFETYKNNDYIVDAKPITDELLRRSIQNLGERIADQVVEDKNRSVALSYAFQAFTAGVTPKEELYNLAWANYQFVKGNKDEANRIIKELNLEENPAK